VKSQTCDVLIVGGGPAGSACAWRLVQAGLDVVVMDKCKFPRQKVCAGWITPQVVEALGIDLADYAAVNVLQPIDAFRIGFLHGPAKEFSYPHTVSYGIRRYEFDDFLLRRSGARLMLGEPVTSIERRDGHWRVNGRLAAPLVIGAGGNFCPVARLLKDHDASEPVVAAQEVEFEMDKKQQAACRVRGEMPELYFCPDLKGYGWCFLKGNYLNVGLGRQDTRKLGGHVHDFCDWLAESGRIEGGLQHRFRGHAYLLYGDGHRALTSDGLLLIGDAAGLAYAKSGEGIRPAIESGLLAAQTVLECQPDYSQANLMRYSDLLKRRFGRPSSLNLTRLLSPAMSQAMGRYMFLNDWFARHVLVERWFLHIHQAPVMSYS